MIGDAVPQFRLEPSWRQEDGVPVHSMITDVATDIDDHVYVMAREPAMVLVYDSDGRFIRAWGSEVFAGRPHGISVASDGFVYCVEDWGNCVQKLTEKGEHVGLIGPSGIQAETGASWEVASNTISRLRAMTTGGGPPYNHPTKLARGANGDLYVADGYGNCKIHRFSSDGNLLGSWGKSGIGRGEFHLPHAILAASDGNLYVADRENDRIQVFDLDGIHLAEWTDLHRPNSIAEGPDGLFYIGEARVAVGRHSFVNGDSQVEKPARVSVFDAAGNRLGEPNGIREEADTHGLTLDSVGNLYVADSMSTGGIWKYARV